MSKHRFSFVARPRHCGRRSGISHRLLVAAIFSAGCAADPASPHNDHPPRTFRMGFSAIPPRADQNATLAALELWTRRADIAMMHVSVPYKVLLSGTTAAAYVDAVDLPLANYYRAKGLPIAAMLDVTDGLNRAAEAPDLVSIGRSITEPAVQAAYRAYATAFAAKIRPSWMGLAAETNLIRETASPAVYVAIVKMSNDAAADIHALGGTLPSLYVSVQADIEWGRILHGNVFQGVERDFADFPFLTVLGVSSYPYFTFPDPEDVPLDYYARLVRGHAVPTMVVEGGWTSESFGNIQSSQAKQARYLRRQAEMLDSAKSIAMIQLTFTDRDVASSGANFGPFSTIGLVTDQLVPKGALATYDSIFARPRK
jgi:hypothetical protein